MDPISLGIGFGAAALLKLIYDRGKKAGREERPERLLEAPKPVVNNFMRDQDGSVIRILQMNENPPRRLGSGK